MRDHPDPRRAAQLRLRARRRRAALLQRRVVVASLIAFVLLWGVVFAQMATGNDPVLGGGSPAKTASRAPDARREEERSHREELEAELAEPEPAETEFVEVEPEPAEEELVEAEPEPAPVTTSQS